MPHARAKGKTVATLQKAGLGENEAVLYAAMLKHPKSTVQDLVGRTPFPRTMLYHVLKNLQTAGLVSAKKDQWRTEYVAENPDRLYELLERRERELKAEIQDVHALVPELKTTYRLASGRPDTQVFEGIAGYKSALEAMVRAQPAAIYQYKAIGKKAQPGVEVREDAERLRRHKRVPLKALLSPSAEAAAWAKGQPYDDYTWYRFAPKGVDDWSGDVYLYGNKTLCVEPNGREPVALLIEDERLTALQTKVFLHVWNQAANR